MFSRAELEKLQTPCFIFDEAELRENFSDFARALKTHWSEHSYVSYSVKTNPFPWILSVAKDCGCMAEVVSDDEYDLALRQGFAPTQIIFNGPVKGRDWFRFAVLAGSRVNIDSAREIRWAQELVVEGHHNLKVGIRANIDLEKFCPGQTIGGDEPGRFGFSYEDGSLAQVISDLTQSGVGICGLHMHATTYGRYPSTYAVLASHAAKIISDYNLESSLQYIDMGGGYYGGGVRNLGKYDEYAKAIAGELAFIDSSKVDLFVEPGGAVICTPGYYVGRVVDTKDVRGTRFVVSELSRLNIDHEMKKTSYPYVLYPVGSNISQNTADKNITRKVLSAQELCGFTCMESDRLCILHDEPELVEDDLILIKYAGAYSMSFTPGFFIEGAPAVYAYLDGSFTCLRERFSGEPPCCM